MNKRFLLTGALLCIFLLGKSQTNQSVKIISYNIWNGFTGDDTTRFDRFVGWVNEKSPDILALQELVGYDSTKLATQALLWGHKYSIILKTGGYPVGITSNSPITLKERILNDMWHGALHCTIRDIEFFVIHLSPAQQDFRKKEAKILSPKIEALIEEGKDVIVLGDFNSVSIADIDYLSKSDSLLNRYKKGGAKDGKYANLLSGQFDYSVMAKFTSISLVDVAPLFLTLEERYSFPAPALIGIWQTKEEVERNKHRIDYILLNPSLANQVSVYKIFHDKLTGSLSDHYPVMIQIDK